MKDIHLTHLDFSNCMLQEGLTELLKGLMNNKTVIFLKLMGNNIRGSGTVALGKLLQLNSHLQQLNLDWNCMGILPDKFFVFCEGLSRNSTLKELDLGHNQLNYECASALANAIQKNICLEILGLQFNSFGSVGGEFLLKALIQNTTLVQMNVEGNNMGAAIENSIEISVRRNLDRKITRQKHVEEAKALANKLKEVENEKNMQVNILTKTLEQKENEAATNKKVNSVKMNQLKEELEDRVEAFSTLNSKCQQLELSLSNAEAKLNDLSNLLHKMEAENAQLRMKHHDVLSVERKERHETESRLYKEIQSYKEHISQLKEQVEDFNQKVTYQEDTVRKLNDTNSKLEKELKRKEADFNDNLQTLKERHAQILKETESLRRMDVSRLNSEYSNMEEHFAQRIQALERQKIQLEMEVGELKAVVEKERLNKEELIEQQQQKMKSEEAKLRSYMEEKLHLIEAAKNKQELLCKEQQEINEELQMKNTALTLELAEETHKVQHLQQCLKNAEDECKLQIAKVQLEVKEQLDELKTTKESNRQLSSELNDLKKQLEDLRVTHSQELKLRDEKVEDVKRELAQQVRKMQTILEDEVKHANQLHGAFTSCFNDIQRVI